MIDGFINTVLLFTLHTCAWFTLAGVSSVARGRGGAMSFITASAMAVFSTAAHMLFIYLCLTEGLCH